MKNLKIQKHWSILLKNKYSSSYSSNKFRISLNACLYRVTYVGSG